MPPFTSSLRAKLFLAFAVISAMTLACAAAAVYAVSTSRALFNDVAVSKLPSLKAAQTLTRETERTFAQMHALFGATSSSEREGLAVAWQVRTQALLPALDDLTRSGLDPSLVAALRQDIQALDEIWSGLEAAVRKRLNLDARRTDVAKAIRATHADYLNVLEPMILTAERSPTPLSLSPSGSPDTTLRALLELRRSVNEAVGTLLDVQIEVRESHLRLAGLRTRSFVERATSLAGSLPPKVEQYLAGLSAALLDFGTGAGSLPALRSAALRAEADALDWRQRTSDLSMALETKLTRLADDTSGAFERNSRAAVDEQAWLIVLVVTLAAGSIVTTLVFGVLFLRRRLADPIARLADDMHHFERTGKVTALSSYADDEIGQLAKSFSAMARSRKAGEIRRERQNQALEAVNRELQRSNRELDDFAYIASHDLKEPLRAIFNHANFLLEDYHDRIEDDGKKRLDRMIKLSRRMEKLISDLLFFSRLGRGAAKTATVDLNEVIDDIETNLADTLREANAAITVRPGLPEITINRAQVTTLFQNLIVNAVKYNDAEKKTVEIGCEPLARGADRKNLPVYYVRDNGIGIEEQFKDEVFRIFKRLHGEKAYGEGTGAGLTFVKKIIENNNGRIWLQSEAGQGSTFFFQLSGGA